MEAETVHRYEAPAFKEWHNVHVGSKDKAAFDAAYAEKGIHISNAARDISDLRLDFGAQTEETVDFVAYPQDMLLLKDADAAADPKSFLTEEFLRAQGLTLCKPTDSWYLREQYLDQPDGQHIYVGMAPVEDRDRSMRVFSLGHYPEGLELATLSLLYGHPDDKSGIHLRTNPQTVWIFRRIKAEQQ